jgi:hypothetical protein
MIIVQQVSLASFWPLSFIGKLTGGLYYISISQKASKLIQTGGSRLASKLSRGLLPIPLSTLKITCGHRDYRHGHEDALYHHSEKYLSSKLIDYASNYFVDIGDIDKKLRLSLVTSFNYEQMGNAVLSASNSPKPVVVYFVHTTLRSYLLRSHGVKGAKKFHHFYLPIDDLITFLGRVKTKLISFLSLYKLRPPENNQQLNSETNLSARTAVLFHNSVEYGPHFKKNHYFSGDIRSPLHKENVACFVLDRGEGSNKMSGANQITLVDITQRYKRGDQFLSACFFLKGLCKIRTLGELGGLIFLAKFYSSYLAWGRSLEDYPNLRNMIIDYDILYPKSLGLVLESRGVRTLALQERGYMSFSYIYGVIADTYFFAGGLYTLYGVSNKSYAYRVAVNFGQWRTSFFSGNLLPDIQEIHFIHSGNKRLCDFDSMICCLGWFIDQENLSSIPELSHEATLGYFLQIKSLAADFPNVAVVLRMKLLYEPDRNTIKKYFSGVDNFFLCDDYSQAAVSYTLCKEAALIISLQTSLADECLAVGKKVVLIDSAHNLSGIFKDIYPQDFHFAIAGDSKEINALVTRCLNGDEELSKQYQELRCKLTGDFDLAVPDAIPKALEAYLQ